MPAPAANRSLFSLALQGDTDDIRVTGFSGQAHLSGLYTYDIAIASKRPISNLKDWLDRAATLTLHGEPNRHIHGLIMQASHTGQGREFIDYRITIVPRLWRLTQSKNHRIFQDKTPNQIISLLLREHSIGGQDFQDHTCDAPNRTYCVQYGESDFAFICRLMNEEGWHFHFQHKKERHILLMADNNTIFASKPGDPAIRYQQETSRAHGENCIHTLDFHHQITSGAVRLGDFDFTRPSLALNEIFEDKPASLQHHDHPGLFDDPVIGLQRAALRLQQAQCQRQTVQMQCHITTLDAGQSFHLTEHPNPALNQQYLITGISVSGTQSQAYEAGAADNEQPFRCTLECIPATVPFRPPHQWRKPTIKGPHSAIVTGPQGEDIYTDQHGRIKVQFHWDREGQADARTSCWVRVNQPLAGIQWGGIAIPRIGQEVIIEFEHGDPDRPIMIGRVYNGQNLPPYPLPQHKTRSVLKTLSSPGGNGFHEIRIEDKKGSEQIFMQAERNMDLRAKNNLHNHIGHDQHITVRHDAFAEINGDLHQSVGGAVNEKNGQSLSLSIGQDLQVNISGAQVIQAGNRIHIKAGLKAIIQGGASLSVKAGAGLITLDASGVAIVGPLVRINEGGSRGSSVKIANPALPGQPAEADNAIPGSKLRAASAATVPIPPVIDFDRTRAQLASLRQAAALGAPLVEIVPAHLHPSTIDDTSDHTFSVKLESHNGKPLANKKFLLDTGSEQIPGVTDAQGHIQVPLKSPFTSGSLNVWPSDQGDPIIISFDHPDIFDAVTTTKGQQARLLNLGYQPGPLDGINGPKTKAAIKQFQQNYGLATDGICGPETQARLQQVYEQ